MRSINLNLDTVQETLPKNHHPVLHLKGEVASSKEGSASKSFEAGDPIFLYLPKNAEGLQVW